MGDARLDWPAQRVIVTGGAGFLGAPVVRRLRDAGVPAESIFVPRRADFDLTRADACEALYANAFPGTRATMVIHLAAEVGGIGANRARPGRYFYANMAMALHLIEGARVDGLAQRAGRFVQVGTICAYPKHTPVPFSEDDLWNGYPEETNAPYGVAKRAAWQMLDAYRREHALHSAYLLPVNLFGPGDNFDLDTSHVIPALVRKCVEAKERGERVVQCWGTGGATREFLYVDDAAHAIVRAAEVMTEPTPINLGTGREIAIRELAQLIARLTGFGGELRWDPTRPDGQPRRRLDTRRAESLLGWRATTTLEAGLQRTIDWFRAHLPRD